MTKTEMVNAIGSLAAGQTAILELLKKGNEKPATTIGSQVEEFKKKGGKVQIVTAKPAAVKKEKAAPPSALLNSLATYFGGAEFTGYSSKEGDGAEAPTCVKFSGGSLKRDFYLPLV